MTEEILTPGEKKRKKRERDTQYMREKYQNDPVYRQERIEYARQRRAKNPEHVNAINAKYRDNPDRREHAAQKSRAWHAANKDYANPRRVQRELATLAEYPWDRLFGSAKKRAKRFNLPYDLTHSWAKERWTGRCEITGIPFDLSSKKYGQMFSPSIDKIDPKLGYVQENCRFILFMVNIFKYNGTDEMMLKVAEAIVKNSINLRIT